MNQSARNVEDDLPRVVWVVVGACGAHVSVAVVVCEINERIE